MHLTLLFAAACLILESTLAMSQWGARRTDLTLIPRGGGGSRHMEWSIDSGRKSSKTPKTVMSTLPKALAPRGGSEAEDATNFLTAIWNSLSNDKKPWAVCFVLSTIYLLLFSFIKSNPCKLISAGFCMTNLNPETGKCTNPLNSHQFSWYADIVFTVLTFALPALKKDWFGENVSTVTKVSNAAIIFGHGFLHKTLGDAQCASEIEGGEQMYTIFVAALAAFTVFGFGSLPLVGGIIAFVALTYGIVKLTLATAMDKAISAMFMSTQMMVSLVALFFPGKAVTPLMGKLFIAPCLVSLIEFLACCAGDGGPALFNKIGGHVWYDIALHTAVIGNMIPAKSDKKDD